MKQFTPRMYVKYKKKEAYNIIDNDKWHQVKKKYIK